MKHTYEKRGGYRRAVLTGACILLFSFSAVSPPPAAAFFSLGDLFLISKEKVLDRVVKQQAQNILNNFVRNFAGYVTNPTRFGYGGPVIVDNPNRFWREFIDIGVNEAIDAGQFGLLCKHGNNPGFHALPALANLTDGAFLSQSIADRVAEKIRMEYGLDEFEPLSCEDFNAVLGVEDDEGGESEDEDDGNNREDGDATEPGREQAEQAADLIVNVGDLHSTVAQQEWNLTNQVAQLENTRGILVDPANPTTLSVFEREDTCPDDEKNAAGQCPHVITKTARSIANEFGRFTGLPLEELKNIDELSELLVGVINATVFQKLDSFRNPLVSSSRGRFTSGFGGARPNRYRRTGWIRESAPREVAKNICASAVVSGCFLQEATSTTEDGICLNQAEAEESNCSYYCNKGTWITMYNNCSQEERTKKVSAVDTCPAVSINYCQLERQLPGAERGGSCDTDRVEYDVCEKFTGAMSFLRSDRNLNNSIMSEIGESFDCTKVNPISNIVGWLGLYALPNKGHRRVPEDVSVPRANNDNDRCVDDPTDPGCDGTDDGTTKVSVNKWIREGRRELEGSCSYTCNQYGQWEDANVNGSEDENGGNLTINSCYPATTYVEPAPGLFNISDSDDVSVAQSYHDAFFSISEKLSDILHKERGLDEESQEINRDTSTRVAVPNKQNAVGEIIEAMEVLNPGILTDICNAPTVAYSPDEVEKKALDEAGEEESEDEKAERARSAKNASLFIDNVINRLRPPEPEDDDESEKGEENEEDDGAWRWGYLCRGDCEEVSTDLIAFYWREVPEGTESVPTGEAEVDDVRNGRRFKESDTAVIQLVDCGYSGRIIWKDITDIFINNEKEQSKKIIAGDADDSERLELLKKMPVWRKWLKERKTFAERLNDALRGQ